MPAMMPPAPQGFKRGDEIFTTAWLCLYSMNIPAPASRTGQVYASATRAIQQLPGVLAIRTLERSHRNLPVSDSHRDRA
jgi:hypothetical protein